MLKNIKYIEQGATKLLEYCARQSTLLGALAIQRLPGGVPPGNGRPRLGRRCPEGPAERGPDRPNEKVPGVPTPAPHPRGTRRPLRRIRRPSPRRRRRGGSQDTGPPRARLLVFSFRALLVLPRCLLCPRSFRRFSPGRCPRGSPHGLQQRQLRPHADEPFGGRAPPNSQRADGTW
jgi:hypothetical protein